MENYSKSKIYKIISKNTKKIYIGSTIRTLEQRLCIHTSHFKLNNCCNSKELLKFGNYEIVLIESYSCKNKTELRIREQFWINKFKFDGYQLVNKYKAYRSEEEHKEYDKKYYEEKKNEYKERNKKYRDDNKNEIKQYRQENKIIIKQYKKEYWKQNKKEIKQYRRENKDKIKQYQKEYWQENKIFQKRSVVKLMSDFINEIQDY